MNVARWICLLAVLLTACGDSDDGSTGMGDGDDTASAGDGAGDADGDGDRATAADADPRRTATGTRELIPEDCRGFDFDGLLYSPGGNVLPNTCEPFHATLNNPYAVRCVDVWPWYDSGFPGDELCILPPPPDQGLQVGVHPQGKDWHAEVSSGDMSGYDGLDDDWTMEPGEEEDANYLTGIETDEDHDYYRNYVRMRAGSHHAIVSHDEGRERQEVWATASPVGLFQGTQLPSVQRVDQNTPDTLDEPEEDAGLYAVLPAGAGVTFNLHHFNSSDRAIMKEMWINIWFSEQAETRIFSLVGLEFGQTGSLALEPGESADLHYLWEVDAPTRVVYMTGHRHAWTTSFSSWVEHEDGETSVVYQSFDWFDQPTYRYNSEIDNPVADHEARIDGGASGILTVQPGERLHFSCHIDYTEGRAQAEGAPSPSEIGTLRFANQAFTGEMCLLYGGTAGIELSAPIEAVGPLPDFAAQ